MRQGSNAERTSVPILRGKAPGHLAADLKDVYGLASPGGMLHNLAFAISLALIK
jgi:hypothetical protein